MFKKHGGSHELTTGGNCMGTKMMIVVAHGATVNTPARLI
jgi:hypothetical protein